MQIKKEQIPWAMAAGRALLGPVVALGERGGWNGMAMAGLVIAALLSDIFDGVLARHWRCDTPAVRRFDSIADIVFYVCAGVAVWIGQPQALRPHAVLLGALVGLEAANLTFAVAKFGKLPSYHSYAAKAWGLVLAPALIAALVSGSGMLMPLALGMGIACSLEGLAMSLMLPVWHKDVRTLRAAWRIRHQLLSRPEARLQAVQPRRSIKNAGLAASSVAALALLVLATPAHAIDSGHAAYWGGTAAIAQGTVGTLNTTADSALEFEYRKPDGSAGQIAMPYAQIKSIEPTQEPVHKLGVLPFIAVSLVSHPIQRYLVTIHYVNDAGVSQLLVFKVTQRDQPMLVEIVNVRAKNCWASVVGCSAQLQRR